MWSQVPYNVAAIGGHCRGFRWGLSRVLKFSFFFSFLSSHCRNLFSSKSTFWALNLACPLPLWIVLHVWFLPFWIVAHIPDIAGLRLLLSWECICTLYLRLKMLIRNITKHLREKILKLLRSKIIMNHFNSYF